MMLQVEIFAFVESIRRFVHDPSHSNPCNHQTTSQDPPSRNHEEKQNRLRVEENSKDIVAL